MAAYTLRIQLVGNPSQNVYDDLHGRMETGGFLRQVTGVNVDGQQQACALPHGTYYGSSDADATVVGDWASAHAREVWGESTVFVALRETWAWSRT